MSDGESRFSWASAGALLGALTGFAYGACEAAWVLAFVPLAFDYAGERLRFSACVIGMLVGAGALAGLTGGVVTRGIAKVAARLGGGSAKRARRVAAGMVALAATPGIGLAIALAFQGRRARLLPARAVIIGVLTGLAGGVVYVATQQATRVLRQRREGTLGRARLLVVSGALAALFGVVWVVDRQVLPRLYPSFHVGLEGVAVVLLALLVALVMGSALRPPTGARGRYATLGVVVGGVAWGTWGARQFGWWQGLRAVAFEHTGLAARLLAVAGALGVTPGPVAPPEPVRPVGAVATAVDEPGTLLPAGPRLADHDVFLITVDAMRADRLTRRTAPHLAALADEGVVFERAYAQVPHTSFSLATLLTGKYVYSLAALGVDPASHETLADFFQRERYKTAAFFPPSVFFIDHDRFKEVERAAYHFEYVRYEYMDAPGRTAQVLRFLDEDKPERVFAWIHYFDPHEPYELHPELGLPAPRTAEERYDGEVRFVDEAVAKLIDGLRRTRRRAIVVFTADHGEEFGEHGGRYHGSTLYEEQVRVPLFVVAWDEDHPRALPSRRVAMPVASIDLAPTMLGLVGITPSARMRGRDLGPWLSAEGAPVTGPMPQVPIFAEIGPKKLIALGDDRLVCDLAHDYCELYDLASDPLEQHNLAAREPERTAALVARLDGWVNGHSRFERDATPARATDLDDRAREALERGRLGDRAAGPEVARLLSNADAGLRREAALTLLHLPDDAATHGEIAASHTARPDEPLLSALALRAGDATLADRLATLATVEELPPMLGPEPPPARDDASARAAGPAASGSEDRLVRAEVALALAAMHHPAAVRALGLTLAVTDDEGIERRLIAALGASGDHAATAPLVDHLPSVRTRVDVVRALGTLGDRAAVPALCALLVDEPYVTVRAEGARVLGGLAAKGDRRALKALAGLLGANEEPIVVGEALTSLARLGGVAAAHGIDLRRRAGWRCDALGCAPPEAGTTLAPATTKPAEGRVAWLIAAAGATGVLEVGETRIEVTAAKTSYPVAVPRGPIVVRTVSGAPRLAAAFVR